jgi:hypothetical protein
MGIVEVELELHKDITAGNDDKTENTAPPTGEFYVTNVHGEGAFDLNCYVGFSFDGVLFWHTKGSSHTDKQYKFTGNGTKKVELILSAVDLGSGSAVLGGGCIVRYKT